MARNFLRAVLFDLGGTLMYERATWDAVNARADEALTNYLRAEGLELNLSTFPREFRKRLRKYFQQREKDLLETTYSFVLRDVLKDKGYGNVPETTLRNALDQLFAVTQTNWTLEEDTRRMGTVWDSSRMPATIRTSSSWRVVLVSLAILISSSRLPLAAIENHIGAFLSWHSPTGIFFPQKRSWWGTISMQMYAVRRT
jgi:hypothetical protein